MNTYNEVLKAVDSFSPDDQLEIAGIIRNRAIEERREELKNEIGLARKELKEGKLKPKSIADLAELDMKDYLNNLTEYETLLANGKIKW